MNDQNKHWATDAKTRLETLAELRVLAFSSNLTTYIDPDTEAHRDSQFMTLYKRWGMSSLDFDSKDEMVKAWDQWLSDQPPAIQAVDNVETLTASLTVEMGGVEVGFSIERKFVVNSEQQRLATTEYLQELLLKQHDNYIKQQSDRGTLARVTPSTSAAGKSDNKQSQAEENAGVITVPLYRIEVEEKANGFERRAYCGDWGKFGVGFYEDTCTLDGFTWEQFEQPQSFPVQGLAKVQTKDGKPKRVVHLSRAS
jgi:hypothetical protein